jgi:Spy/CpxP family protein refolding chaperone
MGVVVLAAGAAESRPHDGGCRGRGHGFGIERLERKLPRLALAPETEKAIYAALDEARAVRRSVDRDIRSAHERLRALLDQDRPTVEEVLAQADLLGALQNELRKAELSALVAVRSLLSPEQWEMLHEKRHERRRGGAATDAS